MRDSIDHHVARWARELPWMDPIKEAIIGRLAILSRHAGHARRDTLTSGGLKHWQFKVLLMLRRVGPPYVASPSQLAEMLGLTRGALSARLAPIEAAGLITRTVDPDDRRRVHVRLTPAGYNAFETHASTEEKAERDLLSALTAKEQRTIADLLRKLVVAIESNGGDGRPAEGRQLADRPPAADGVDATPQWIAECILGAGSRGMPMPGHPRTCW